MSHTAFPKYIYATNALHECDLRGSKVAMPLFNDEEIPDDGLLFSGRIASPQVQPVMLGAWMNHCISQHGTNCRTTSISWFVRRFKLYLFGANCMSSKIRAFRLIDVKTKAVERFDNVDLADLKYLALSYVWGGAQRLIINLDNMKQLEITGSLIGAVSKTIEDAMHLTDLLGIQYLWVDALCILQDDTPDKTHHLSFIGEIYRHCLLTIIAASGVDAEAGLPGLREPRTFRQHIIKAKDSTLESPQIHLVTAQTVRPMWYNSYFFGAKWMTRGWTLQERALSSRTIVFTENQVYWNCRGATWTEEIFAETNMTSSKSKFYDFDAGSPFMKVTSEARDFTDIDDGDELWDILRSQIAEYSSRDLTIQGDAYDAFSGILQEFRAMTGENFLWGIPVTQFELGLCWNRRPKARSGTVRATPLARREGLTSLPMTTLCCRVAFPSWSWLCWEGSAEMCFTNQYRETG